MKIDKAYTAKELLEQAVWCHHKALYVTEKMLRWAAATIYKNDDIVNSEKYSFT